MIPRRGDPPAFGPPTASTWFLIACCLALAGLVVGYVSGSLFLHDGFPRRYTWTDLLISYSGGFVRRGLVGSLALRAHDAGVRLDLVVPALVFAGYTLVAAVVMREVARQRRLVLFAIALSPACLLFPALDVLAYGRKDLVVAATYLVTVLIAVRLPPWRAFLIGSGLYALSSLIIDTSVLYYPIFVAGLPFLARTDVPVRRQMALYCTGALICAALLVVHFGYGSASADQASAIIETWRSRLPEAYPRAGAVGFLGMTAEGALSLVLLNHQAPGVTTGYILAALLVGLPFVAAWRDAGLRNRTGLAPLAAFGVGLAMLVPFCVAADWGRVFHLLTLHALIFTLWGAVRSGRPEPAAPGPLGYAVALLYITSWKLVHFSPLGSAVLPGLLFDILGTPAATP